MKLHVTNGDFTVFKLIAGRSPAEAPLVSQSTLPRFESDIDISSLFRLRDVLIDPFLHALEDRPED